MRFIHMADIHLGAVPDKGKPWSAKRTEEIETTFYRLLQEAGHQGVDLVLIAGDVFQVLDSISEKPDVIVVDPPRAGIQEKALDKIISYGVSQIVYISCNPKTLAENLRYLQYYGYCIEKVKAFDNFPFTKHIETVVQMNFCGKREK